MINILDNAESSEVRQIAELLREIESEYKHYLLGAISVDSFNKNNVSVVSDIKEITIPVRNDIDQKMLIEDMEDLIAILVDTDAVITIVKKYEQAKGECNIEIARA